jgi:hypothetical protein
MITEPKAMVFDFLVQMSIQALQARIIKNQEEQFTLLLQKHSMTADDIAMGEDPEMIDEKM